MSAPQARTFPVRRAPADSTVRRQLGTGGTVALAAAVWLGACLAAPVPLGPGAGLGLAGWWLRRPVLVVLGAGLLASALGSRAVAGLAPVEPAPFAGTVELVTDPRPHGLVEWRAEVRLPSGRRVHAVAFGPAGADLSGVAAGQRVVVEGRVRPLGTRSAWSDSRHLVGTLDVERAGPAFPGSPLVRAAGAVRRAVGAGADALPEQLRPLYLGLVIGDDRFQPAAQRVAFRAAGLSHLLAVSGQNVAFVLLVAGPVLRRLSTWPRFALIVSVLVLFATVTRYEPSVLRATATAGLVAWSVALGRPNRGLRILALAVAALVLVDPLLVRSVGFQLSVLASGGILALAGRIEEVLPGPRWLREPLAVTLGAQFAVLPLLATVFGPVSLVSVPANLAAAWAAALVMTWGLTVGVLAGALPDAVAPLVQLPATASVAWIDAVARVAAPAPAPRISAPLVAPVLTAAAVAAVSLRRRALPAVAVAAAAGLVLLASAPASPTGPVALSGATWCPDGDDGFDVLVVHDGRRVEALLGDLLDRRIRTIDALVLESGGRADGAVAAQLRRLLDVGVVLAPPQHQVRGARRLTSSLPVPNRHRSLIVEVVGPESLSVPGCAPGAVTGGRDVRGR